MVKLSRVEQGLSHELGVCLGYAQPRPEYSCFVATARMGLSHVGSRRDSRTAASTTVSSTGCTSEVERLMTLSTSLVAV